MGNLQQQCRGVTTDSFELDRADAIYSPDEIVSGTVSHLKHRNASITLTGTIYYKKRKRTSLEKCRVVFFSTELQLSSHSKQTFELRLDACLPPSFHSPDQDPNVSYAINLISKKSKDQIVTSIPIHVCPRVFIDRPLLLAPLFFGPVENQTFGVTLEVKVNRGAFAFDDMIQVFYELQNPNREHVHQCEITLGIYYSIESNVWQEDVCRGMESLTEDDTSKNKLVRSKALLSIPKRLCLPPTYKYQYDKEGEQSAFNLTIEYKIQFQIYLGEEKSVWQVDIPIVMCTDTSEANELVQDDLNIETNRMGQSVGQDTIVIVE